MGGYVSKIALIYLIGSYAMKLKLIFLACAILLLAGCVSESYQRLSEMNPQQLQHVSDTQLCEAIHDQHGEYQQKFIDEKNRRGIKYCNNGELYCRSLGINYGDERYPACFMYYDQQALAAYQINSQNYYQQQQLNQSRRELNANKRPWNNTNNTSNVTTCKSRPNYAGGYNTTCY